MITQDQWERFWYWTAVVAACCALAWALAWGVALL